MIQKHYICHTSIQTVLLYVNSCKSKKLLKTVFYKYVYSKFFFERSFNGYLLNSSVTSFFSFWNKPNFVNNQRFSLIFFDKSFYYWNNNYFVREYTDLSSVNSNFVVNDYRAYIYVIIWSCVFCFMV